MISTIAIPKQYLILMSLLCFSIHTSATDPGLILSDIKSNSKSEWTPFKEITLNIIKPCTINRHSRTYSDLDNPIFGFALRFLAKTVIKRAIKKGVKRKVKNKVARYGINKVVDYAVDEGIDEINRQLRQSEKDMISQHWDKNTNANHFSRCPLCNRVGKKMLKYAENSDMSQGQVFLNQNKNDRKKGFPGFMIGVDYFYSSFAPSQDPAYNSNTFKISGFSFNAMLPILNHKISPAISGALVPSASIRSSTFRYIKGDGEDVKFFKETYYNIGIGYGLLIGNNSKFKLMIEPTYGLVLNSKVKTGNFSINGSEVEEDFFQIENSDQRAFYKGIITHIIVGNSADYLSGSGPICLSLGILWYDSIPIIINPDRSSGIRLAGGRDYKYPDNFFNYHFGIRFLF